MKTRFEFQGQYSEFLARKSRQSRFPVAGLLRALTMRLAVALWGMGVGGVRVGQEGIAAAGAAATGHHGDALLHGVEAAR
jgi:hypothetical protein